MILSNAVSFPSEIHLSSSDTDPDRAEQCYHGYQNLGGGGGSSPPCFLCTPQLLWHPLELVRSLSLSLSFEHTQVHPLSYATASAHEDQVTKKNTVADSIFLSCEWAYINGKKKKKKTSQVVIMDPRHSARLHVTDSDQHQGSLNERLKQFFQMPFCGNRHVK